MARYTGPKFKLDRREGTNLFLKGKRSVSGKHPIDKKGAVPPGQHGPRAFRKKVSDFGLQLREKQKVKRMYGILERQFKKYFEIAAKEKGNTGEASFRILETRLDNVIYKLGFAPSRASARQMVSHGHVKVNEGKVNIPSYNVKVGDTISISTKMQNSPAIKESMETRGEETPEWMKRQALVGKVMKEPVEEDFDIGVDKQLIIEYYSR